MISDNSLLFLIKVFILQIIIKNFQITSTFEINKEDFYKYDLQELSIKYLTKGKMVY
jgi:hypothetical protein